MDHQDLELSTLKLMSSQKLPHSGADFISSRSSSHLSMEMSQDCSRKEAADAASGAWT